MARFFITGSSDGLGSLTAQRLITQGHRVVIHARNADRARDALATCPGAEAVLVADLSSIHEAKTLAAEANKLGPYDAVIHNAGVLLGMERVLGKSGLPTTNAKREQLLGSAYSDTKLHNVMLAQAFARHWPKVESNSPTPGGWPPKWAGRRPWDESRTASIPLS